MIFHRLSLCRKLFYNQKNVFLKQVSPGRVYYHSLDGIRGFVILLVLFSHNFSFIAYSKFCESGVDLFFVLSGFLITEILLTTKKTKNYLQTFYLRRVLRIFPVYYLALIAFFILAPYCMSLKEQYSYYESYQFYLWFYLQNWLPIFHDPPFHDTQILGHFWSLSVEEHFYIFWPFLILIFKKPKLLTRVCLLILFGFILFRFTTWMIFGNSDINYRLQFNTRMDGLCIGSLIAIWKFANENIKIKILKSGLALIVFHLLVAIISKTIFTTIPHFSLLGYTSISVLFGILIVLAIENKNRIVKTLFEFTPLSYIGKNSYGLYIYHLPVLVLFRIYFLSSLKKSGLSPLSANIFIACSAFFVALLISSISYHFFEKKILKLKEMIVPGSLELSFSKKDTNPS